MTLQQVVNEIKQRGEPNAVVRMSRFGIRTGEAFGVAVPRLRHLARQLGTNHELARQLWKAGIHEARILAGMIDDPARVTEDQMDEWALEFDSWDVVDQCCGNLFDKTPFAIAKAHEWSTRHEEFVKRAGFVLMAELAVHDKNATDETFLGFLPLIINQAEDDRNFVKKAVNWALRQIGKRNRTLNRAAMESCGKIQRLHSRSAQWIASDALRELTSTAVQKRFKNSPKQAPQDSLLWIARVRESCRKTRSDFSRRALPCSTRRSSFPSGTFRTR